ncbi:MAG: hypothetical protein ABIJ34_08530 [archaeon]
MDEIHIAIVDDQTDERVRNLWSILNAGKEYGCAGISFKAIDLEPFKRHEDQPFFTDMDWDMAEFLKPNSDYKRQDSYIFVHDSPYVLHVGWDGMDAIAFAKSGLDILLINRQMVNIHGNSAVNTINSLFPDLPIIIITGDDEGQLTQFSPPVYTQPYDGHDANVAGFVHKRWGLFKRGDATGIQTLALLHPELYGPGAKEDLISKHIQKYGPLLSAEYDSLIKAAEIDKAGMPYYYNE